MSSGCCVYLISFCGGAFCSFIKRMIFATSICHVNNGHISYVQNGWFLSCGSQHSNVYTPIWTYTYLRDLSWKNVLINLIEPRPTVQSQLLKFTGTCLCYIDSISGGSWIESFQLFLAIAHLTYQHKRYNLLTHLMIMYLLLFISTNWQIWFHRAYFKTGIQTTFELQMLLHLTKCNQSSTPPPPFYYYSEVLILVYIVKNDIVANQLTQCGFDLHVFHAMTVDPQSRSIDPFKMSTSFRLRMIQLDHHHHLKVRFTHTWFACRFALDCPLPRLRMCWITITWNFNVLRR